MYFFLVSSGQTLYQAAPLATNTSLLQRFTAESSWELKRAWGNWTTSRGKCRYSLSSSSNVNSVPFSLYLYPLPSPSPPSLLSLLINPLHSVSPMAHILHSVSHHDIFFFNNALYKLVKTKFWCLSSNLSYPEELKKQWLHCRVRSRKF